MKEHPEENKSTLLKELESMLLFEEKLQKFEKSTLSMFIILLLDKREYNKALELLRELEETSTRKATND